MENTALKHSYCSTTKTASPERECLLASGMLLVLRVHASTGLT